ncbi:MAG: peptidylprolyl isomerase [Calditrichia bacterium]
MRWSGFRRVRRQVCKRIARRFRELNLSGFAAFGKVSKGMDVVRRIQQRPSEKQMLVEKVNIEKVTRLK